MSHPANSNTDSTTNGGSVGANSSNGTKRNNAFVRGYTEEGEKILGHVPHNRDGPGQLLVEKNIQGFPYVKVLPNEDFHNKVLDAYRKCSHALAVGGLADNEKLGKIIHVASGPDTSEESVSYIHCEKEPKGEVWVTPAVFESCHGGKTAKLLLKQFTDQEERFRAILDATPVASAVESASPPSTHGSVQPTDKVRTQLAAQVNPGGKLNPTNLLSFVNWFERNHHVKLGPDHDELDKLIAAIKDIHARLGSARTSFTSVDGGGDVRLTDKDKAKIPDKAGKMFNPDCLLSYISWYEGNHQVRLGADVDESVEVVEGFKAFRKALGL